MTASKTFPNPAKWIGGAAVVGTAIALSPLKVPAIAYKLTAAIAAWESGWWVRRRLKRTAVYNQAKAYALQINRPLVVIGAPDSGPTSGYGCGDLTLDIAPTQCTNSMVVDVTKPIPLPDDCCVVFCSCVLEYVDDHIAAIQEIQRISGGHAFFGGVEPWTLTAIAYPSAKRTLPSAYR